MTPRTHSPLNFPSLALSSPLSSFPLVVVPFDSDEEAIELANDNIYGLAGSIWTKDISRAMRYSSMLDAGTVWINNHDIVDSNMPCGGFKQSGFGKDMGPEQLQYFTRTKAIWLSV